MAMLNCSRLNGLVLFLFFTFLSSHAAAATYYVSTTGDNDNPGTEASPWRTLSHAAVQVEAGDTVYVRGGAYVEILNIRESGSSDSPITFMNYSGETPVVDGDSSLPGGDWSPLVGIRGAYIIFDGFEVMNSTGHGITVDGGNFSIVRNCRLHHHFRSGIITENDANYTLIEGNVVHHCDLVNENRDQHGWPAAVVTVESIGTTIRHNIVYNNYGEGIGLFRRSQEAVAEFNTCYDNYAVQIYADCGRNNTIRYNLCYGTMDESFWRGNGPGFGIVLNNEEHCYDESWAGGHAIYGNLIAGTKGNFGIRGGGGRSPRNTVVYNNTIVQAYNNEGTPTAVTFFPGFNNTFKNNIILQDTGTIANFHNDAVDRDYNLWSQEPDDDAKGPNDPSYGPPQLSKSSGWNELIAGSVDGSQFALLTGSTAIDSGADMGEPYNLLPDCDTSEWPDTVAIFNQNEQGTGWEIGADIFVEFYPEPDEVTEPGPDGPPDEIAENIPEGGEEAAESVDRADSSDAQVDTATDTSEDEAEDTEADGAGDGGDSGCGCRIVT